jgi:hypothetical protein
MRLQNDTERKRKSCHREKGIKIKKWNRRERRGENRTASDERTRAVND